MDFFKHYPRKKIDLATIEEHYKLGNYQELYYFIYESDAGVIDTDKQFGVYQYKYTDENPNPWA